MGWIPWGILMVSPQNVVAVAVCGEPEASETFFSKTLDMLEFVVRSRDNIPERFVACVSKGIFCQRWQVHVRYV